MLATLGTYPVRRQSMRGLWRPEVNLDLARRNLAAPNDFPKLAQVVGTPTATLAGLSLKGSANYLATDLAELSTMTIVTAVQAPGDLSDPLQRPMFYSNFYAEGGVSIFISTNGSGPGRGRVVTGSWSTTTAGTKANDQAFVDDVDLRQPLCIAAVHTPTQVRLSFPGTAIAPFIRTRDPGATRLLATGNNMRIGSSYRDATSFAGPCNVAFLADYAAELTDAEIALVRTTELAWHGKIGSGVTF